LERAFHDDAAWVTRALARVFAEADVEAGGGLVGRALRLCMAQWKPDRWQNDSQQNFPVSAHFHRG
jgi:hypothetical protein